jgi:hypothetical protein
MAAKDNKSEVSISHLQWRYTLQNQKHVRTILRYITFDVEFLPNIIVGTFPQRTKEVEKLMNGINMVQKARLAYILGLIDKTVQHDLEQLHEVRNIFAHSRSASFANTKVLKFVRKLSTAKGQEVTAKNSYKFYEDAESKCVRHLHDVSAKQEQEAQKV